MPRTVVDGLMRFDGRVKRIRGSVEEFEGVEEGKKTFLKKVFVGPGVIEEERSWNVAKIWVVGGPLPP